MVVTLETHSPYITLDIKNRLIGLLRNFAGSLRLKHKLRGYCYGLIEEQSQRKS